MLCSIELNELSVRKAPETIICYTTLVMHSVMVNTAILSFAAGVAWQGLFKHSVAFAALLLLLGFALMLLVSKYKTSKQDLDVTAITKYMAVLIIAIFTFTLGVVRMDIAQGKSDVSRYIYDTQLGEQVELVGIIINEPDVREYTTNLVIRLLSEVSDTSQIHPTILVKARPHQIFSYGDKVQITGKLEKPSNFTGDTGRVFDYVNFLAKDGLHYMVKYPNIEVLEYGQGNVIKAWLFSVKALYIDTLSELIPEPQAGLAAGITVGAKRALGSELMEAFRNTGLIHIVVLSGFNVTIIIIFLLRATAILPRSVRYGLATIAVVLFAILTGADAPVVRASAMGLLGVAAIVLGRSYNITRALLIVALAMIIWNPMILMHDIAFQLSVVATLGLIHIAPKIINILSSKGISESTYLDALKKEKLPSMKQSLIEIVSVTIAAQIAVLPLLIYYMGEVSVVSVIVNVLALPIIPIAMLFAFIVGIAGMFNISLALPFAYVTYSLLAYIIWLVEFFNALPMTTVQIF